jgi:recombination protein RecT
MTEVKDQGQQKPTPVPTPVPEISPLALYKKNVVDAVALKVTQYIKNGELNLPHSYSVNNAIKSAWLILQQTFDRDNKPALEVCTRNSVANALLDMVVQGLNPGKKQCYFIVYGKTLTCQRSYFGSMAVAQMVNPRIWDFAYAVVYEGDKFTYGIINGKKTVTLHEQSIENVNKQKIIAAYCILLDKNGEPIKTEIMTMDEIKQSWRQSKMNPIDDKGNVKDSSMHGKFTADMALKTVINKTCKFIINASSDSSLLLDLINRNDEIADAEEVRDEIDSNANTGEVLGIEHDDPAPDVTQVDVKPETVGHSLGSSRVPGF